jgi:glutaredoxin
MIRTLIAASIVLGASLAAGAALAQDQQVYRYIDADGRVVYSDRLPPSSAKSVQPKRLTNNYIQTNEIPLEAQQAAERFPVTLYTFECGEPCQNAEGLLNKRGVPFSTVVVSEPQGAAKLQALTGELNAPVLQVGDKIVIKGYSEARWQAMLDEAGYPKTPAPRRVVPGRSTVEPERTVDANAVTAVQPPAKGTDYPKEQ